MKLIYNQEVDSKEIRMLCKLFIRQRKGSEVSGSSMRVWVNQVYGIDINHHEYAYALDAMTRTDETIQTAHNWGDTLYLVK